jgi:hypothetical protein
MTVKQCFVAENPIPDVLPAHIAALLTERLEFPSSVEIQDLSMQVWHSNRS